ncbi:hypothetical protein AMTRI_Chr03g141250 [Amborella trichopoda]
MDVLYRCIKEALRLQSTIMLILRTSHSDFTMPKGQIVVTSASVANRLDHVFCFRTHNSFDSDRFGPGRVEDKT